MSAGISLVDADNCYDQISHAIATLVFHLFGMSKEATGSMLKTIQEMKFFLCMAYGDLKECAGSLVDVKTQGLCQGNGAALAGWAVVSIIILRAHKWKGHGIKLLCPISLINRNLVAVLYMNDTDVVHFNMTQNKNTVEALAHLQESATNCGHLLIATGGSLKPSKCFYHLISFLKKPDGMWVYDRNKEDKALQLVIPLLDGDFATIENCGVDHVHKTLGMMTCPSKKNGAALTYIRNVQRTT
jgi:hypothetical protein